MALNSESLKANASLNGLNDEQISTIVTLSKNDEEVVIGSKIGELHGGYDKDIFEVSGVEKASGEKSYAYAKRVIADFKAKAEAAKTYETELGQLKGKVAEYEEVIKSGKGSEQVAQQLKDAQTELSQFKSKYDKDVTDWKLKEEQYQTSLLTTKQNFEFDKVATGIKFKSAIPAELHSMLVSTAKEKVLSTYKADWIDDGKGGTKMVFRDAKGEIARNPENKLEPFTASELLLANLKDTIEPPRRVTGGGGQSGKPDDNYDLVDLSSAKTQIEADEIISKYLLKKGVSKTDPSFSAEQRKIRDEYKIASLPIR